MTDLAALKRIVDIDTDRCKGCGLCVKYCPVKILKIREIEVNRKGYHPALVDDQEPCTGCCSCALMCPDSVITIQERSSTRRVDHV